MIISIGIASAQEKEHALEITIGYPSLLFEFEFPINKSFDNGQCISKEYYQSGINVGYTYSWSERWELSALVNALRSTATALTTFARVLTYRSQVTQRVTGAFILC